MPDAVDVVAGILWRDGQFLAVERPEGKPQAGYWEFPGGKVEPGETPQAALVRELQEELGLTPTAFTFWQEKTHAYEHIRVRLLFFHVTAFTGDIVANEGHRWQWLTPGATNGAPFLEADTEIVAELADNCPRSRTCA
ncbi:(deoxy)nucleoside triphosphate pyrophosphohydrolase [Desulfobaculum senezii]|jgi:8-oxo-dGTP diphosphatase